MPLSAREPLSQQEGRRVFLRVHPIIFMSHVFALFKMVCFGSESISDARMRYDVC